jgi:hypothetical protein
LQETTATAAAIIIGTVGSHVDEIFFPDHGFDDIAQVLGDRITQAFADQLARILSGKLNLPLFIPV